MFAVVDVGSVARDEMLAISSTCSLPGWCDTAPLMFHAGRLVLTSSVDDIDERFDIALSISLVGVYAVGTAWAR